MSDHSQLPTLTVVDGSEHACFIDGWHDRERDGRCGITYRAAAERGVIRIHRLGEAKRVYCLLTGPRGLAKEDLSGSVRINGREQLLTLKSELWVLRSFSLQDSDNCELKIEFILTNPLCPDHVLHNGDGRRLGWMVSAVWQE